MINTKDEIDMMNKTMNKKIIYINIDGFSYSYYQKLKKLNLDKDLLELQNDGCFFTNLHSGLVSITNPMQGAILCGAWSNKTHNFYMHFDKDERKVVKHKRTLDATNVATLYKNNNKTVTSIHQFMLENNPCTKDDLNCNYITTINKNSNSFERFEILFDLIKNNKKQEISDLICLYIDDLDSMGHNNDYENFPKRSSYQERIKDIIIRLQDIIKELVKLKNLLIEEKLYEDVIVLVTTDHGMTPLYGKTNLYLLKEKINEFGLKTKIYNEDLTDCDIVLLPYQIECGIYLLKDINNKEKQKLVDYLKNLDIFLKVLTKKEMITKYQLANNGPDILVCAKKNSHFSLNDVIYQGNHDSLDKTSQHIFGLIFGGEVNHSDKRMIRKKVTSIDLIPTIVKYSCGLLLNDDVKHYDFW